MSYTVQIYLEREINQNALVQCLTDLDLSLNSPGLTDPSEELVFFDKDENPIVILGPVKLVQPEVHSNLSLSASWLITVDLPGDALAAPPVINELAKRLTKDYGGFLVDPQIANSPTNPTPSQQSAKTISFIWCTVSENLETNRIPEFLELIHRSFPCLFPSLYGVAEPLQFSYSGKPSEQKPLLKILAETDVFYLRSVDASLNLNFYLDTESLDDSCAMVEMTVPNWQTTANESRLEDCFRLICQKFACFYGGVIVGDSGSSNRPSPFWKIDRHGFWNGIPTNYTWLAWFGEPLLSKVRSHIPGEFWIHGAGSNLVKMSNTPATEDQLSPIFPTLPESVLDLDGELRSRPLGQ